MLVSILGSPYFAKLYTNSETTGNVSLRFTGSGFKGLVLLLTSRIERL